jgi:hypothetical protein
MPAEKGIEFMATPTRGLNNLRTLSGRVDSGSLTYRSYMQVTCLEMEKARRGAERRSASQRVALIDARLKEIETTQTELLNRVSGETGRAPKVSVKGAASRMQHLEVRPTPKRMGDGFKIRY